MHLGNTVAWGPIWAIVLAGGDGTRLRSLTKDGAGNAVPKQFCSFSGGTSLLKQTLDRARSIVEWGRITTIVSVAHTRYWQQPLRILSPENVIVQPVNRGTAVGILLPTLRILEREPDARLLILPSDHYVADEFVLEASMRAALEAIGCHPTGVAFLGIEAHDPDPELGYIVPRPGMRGCLREIHRFVEKPAAEEARRLCQEGALWNSFILACRAQSLIELYRARCPEIVQRLEAVRSGDYTTLCEAYRELPQVDFSRQIATGQEKYLTVVAVPRCGWTDLGTPQRLARAVARYIKPGAGMPEASWSTPGDRINLAERYMHGDGTRDYPYQLGGRQ